jgi:hypothetical protein
LPGFDRILGLAPVLVGGRDHRVILGHRAIQIALGILHFRKLLLQTKTVALARRRNGGRQGFGGARVIAQRHGRLGQVGLRI